MVIFIGFPSLSFTSGEDQIEFKVMHIKYILKESEKCVQSLTVSPGETDIKNRMKDIMDNALRKCTLRNNKNIVNLNKEV